jgi:hypothetical protein
MGITNKPVAVIPIMASQVTQSAPDAALPKGRRPGPGRRNAPWVVTP